MENGNPNPKWPVDLGEFLNLSEEYLFFWEPGNVWMTGPGGLVQAGELGAFQEALERSLVGEDRGQMPVEVNCPLCGGNRFRGSARCLGSERWVGVLRDVTAECAERERLLHQANQDWLTGLWNRRGLARRVEEFLQKKRGSCALLMIDLDNFKGINDHCGHPEGDRILMRTAQLLKEYFPSPAQAGRAGGDEFLLFLPLADETAACEAGEIFCKAFRTGATALSCSVGIAVSPSDGADFETLFFAADQAMYRAKAHGKDTWSR